ncbi:MAG: FtsX-like permease family protein [Clostridia bacterium]|nr:FtsX-like permease family protein [Clostridia bacterium]
MTYSQRVKEFGVLSSIGMEKKQRTNLLLKESFILATIGIVIGIIIGVLLSFFTVKILNGFISGAMVNITGDKILVNPSVRFYMVVTRNVVFLTLVVIYIATIISSMIPMKKINRIYPVEAIRKINKVKAKEIKIPKFIKSIFKQEGELAYKNIKRDKSINKTIVISIITSMVLFLSLSDILKCYLNRNLENDQISKENQLYCIKIGSATKNIEETKKIIEEDLNEKGLIQNYLWVKDLNVYSPSEYKLKTKENEISEEIKELSKSHMLYIYKDDENLLYNVSINVLSGKEYEEFINMVGIEELKNGECIISDIVTNETKYGRNIKATTYEKGDTITIKEVNSNNLIEYNKNEEDSKKGREYEQITQNRLKELFGEDVIIQNLEDRVQENEYKLKIVHTMNAKEINKKHLIKQILSKYPCCQVFISEETSKEWKKSYEDTILYIYTDNSDGIDSELENIKKKVGEGSYIIETNIYKEQTQRNNIGMVKKIVIYGFITFISMFSALNIFITIISNINLRKIEFAVLKSMGMDKNKINKMLLLEGIFYGLNAIIYGILISCIILYMIYRRNFDIAYDKFVLPWLDITICIISIYVVIFMAIYIAKSKVKSGDIVDDIKDENI